jgi:8-oxo-dGTP pyrophosphatase MutT (NUDIX family)
MTDSTKACVHYVDGLEFTFAPWSWPLAEERRREIDAFFRRESKANPYLWNGRLLLLRDARVAAGVLSGSFFETDYASLLAALAWNAMEHAVKACFAAAAVFGSDDGLIVGEMAGHTRNAGQLLFPSGSVERADVVGDHVDFSAALQRELAEETGITPDFVRSESGWYAVNVGSRLPLIKIVRLDEPAERIKDRISTNLAAQSQPEFCDIIVVRDLSDLTGRMPPWVTAFLRHIWR